MTLENNFNNPESKLEKSNVSFVSKDTGLTPEELDEKYIIHPKHHALASNVADFVPVIGSVKMIKESISGEQMGTNKKIEGWRRLVHGAAGAGFLAADLTGIGAIGSVAGKALVRGGLKIGEKIAEKTIEKSAVESSEKILTKNVNKLVKNGEKRNDMEERV